LLFFVGLGGQTSMLRKVERFARDVTGVASEHW